MATYLEVVAPLKLIAEYQGVAVSTVETLVKIGRSNGAIPEASEVRSRKRGLKEKGLMPRKVNRLPGIKLTPAGTLQARVFHANGEESKNFSRQEDARAGELA